MKIHRNSKMAGTFQSSGYFTLDFLADQRVENQYDPLLGGSSLEGEYIEETGYMRVEMKDFRRNLPLLLLVTSLTVVLNCAELLLHSWLSIDFWLLKKLVIIDDFGLLACVLFWTANHVLVFAKATAQEYNNILDKLCKYSASKRGRKIGNGN